MALPVSNQTDSIRRKRRTRVAPKHIFQFDVQRVQRELFIQCLSVPKVQGARANCRLPECHAGETKYDLQNCVLLKTIMSQFVAIHGCV